VIVVVADVVVVVSHVGVVVAGEDVVVIGEVVVVMLGSGGLALDAGVRSAGGRAEQGQRQAEDQQSAHSR